MVSDLGQRHVGRSLDQGEYLRSMTLDPSRTTVATLRSRLTGAGASPLANQFDRCRWRHAEPAGGASTTHALVFHRLNNTNAKIRREGFSHGGLASITSPQGESRFASQGNLEGSVRSRDAAWTGLQA